MGHTPSPPIPATQGRHTRLNAVSETEEEKLQTENYLLKQEHRNLQQKYDRVVDKNRRWSNKDEDSERTMAGQKAEIARLETRNMRTLKELKESVTDVAGLNTRNAELEDLCRKHADEIQAEEKRFDGYVRAVNDLAS
jgi:chromosome segregation ATPase